MVDFHNYNPNKTTREELIRRINRSLEALNDSELEALYYEMQTRHYTSQREV